MLLVDGYNVLLTGGAVTNLREARETLVREIEAYCARTGRRARLYFDSREGPLRGQTTHVEVIYVPAGTTADAAIIETVTATQDRTAYCVVTSDREIADAARRHKMAVIPSDRFRRALLETPPGLDLSTQKRDGISEGEAKAWLREFGMEEESQ